MILTGRLGVRFGWFGKLVVQVEAEELGFGVWKDATINTLVRAMEIASKRNAAEHSPAKEKP